LTGFRPTAAQQHLIEAITRAVEAEPRIESAWLAGSLASGEGDAWSDVDMLAVADEAALSDLVHACRANLDAIAPTLHVMTLHGRIVSAVTADWARFDITFVPPDGLQRRDPASVTSLFARAGSAVPNGAPAAPQAPTAADIEALVREFLRVLGLTAVGVGRDDCVLLVDGAVLLRSMAIDLMLGENGRARTERGVKRVSQMLTPEQRAAIAALPPLAATRESALASVAALAQLFLPRARALTERLGAPWPAAFEAGTRAYLERALNLSF
jgi:predicted nucleotidyltransferase